MRRGMRGSIVPLIAALGLTATAALVAQQPAGQQQPAAVGDALQGVPGVPVFRSTLNLVLVDVVVRDKSGAVVRGLTPDDFELLEDGVRQKIVTLAYEEIKPGVEPIQNASVLANVRPDNRPAVAVGGNTAKPAAAEPHPLTSDETAGHRLVTLVFDTSSMEPDNVQKAVDAAADWVDTRMTSADLVAVATIGSGLQVLADFSSDPEQVHAALSTLSAAHGTAFDAVDASTTATDEQLQSATDDSTTVDQSAQELDTFNNDVRLRALKTLAEALQPIQQKKALIYFSAGMERSGTDNQVELRAAVNAAVRANVSIYPVDARGLQAVVPGGSARQASRGGLAAFSGSAVSRQFSQLAAQQETLTSLASDTGGTAFTDTNDFGEAFARVERDISSYYLLGFSSTNTNRDGRYRRITVRVRNRSGLKIQAKEGYYADRDFAHTARNDREVQLQEQLGAAIAATDVPLFVTTGWFRLAPDKYYVPISVAVPGSAISPRQEGAPSAATGLDIAGFIRDERGFPVGRIRDTITVPPANTDSLASRQVLYRTSVTLPPGRFSVKVVVRENADGLMGTFETPIVVPELKQSPVKVSSIVLGTQLQSVDPRKASSPVAHEGVEVVPNLTHIVGHNQELYFYYEVYDPTLENGTARLQTNLSFYRGKVKVFDTPLVERSHIDAADRKAAIFQFEIPAGSVKPGLYTCQVNIIDEAGGHFAFPRLQLYVR